MRKCSLAGWLLAVFMGLAVSACGDDSPVEGNDGNGNGNGGNDGSTPGVVEPSLDEESLKFVGSWSGMGPYPKNSYGSFLLKNGVWDFHNDGTYAWKPDISSDTQKGTWHYNAEKNMLVTDNAYGFNWSIEEVREGQWLGTLLNGTGGTYTYIRNDKAIACSDVRVADYRKGGFVLKDTVINYQYYAGALKCGVCYAPSSESEVENFTKVYADGIYTDTTYYKNNRVEAVPGVYRVEIGSLEENGKYRLRSFIEREDGQTIYGNEYRAVCVTPPDHTVYMGEAPAGYYYGAKSVHFWSTGFVNKDGSFSDMNEGERHDYQEAKDCLSQLGEGWRLPSLDEVDYLINKNGIFRFIECSLIYGSPLPYRFKSYVSENILCLNSSNFWTSDFSYGDESKPISVSVSDDDYYVYRGGDAGLLPIYETIVTW